MQAYKFELMPTNGQSCSLRQYAGCCRVVYNKALAKQIEQFQADNTTKFSYTRLANMLPAWKNELDWLKVAPSQILQQSLKNLESSYKNFFTKRASFPKFKKKGCRDSFRFPQGFKIEQQNNRIFLPKLGWIRYRNSRKILGTTKNITISQKAGKWYASVQTEREVEPAVHPSISMVGVDVGIAKFATLSDGQVFEAVNSFKQKQVKLAKYQRDLSRKVKFSNNWKKQKNKITRLHNTIANIRKDYLHKTTTTISKNHAVVVVEDLQIKNMSKSAKGTLKSKGRNVKAKSGLNRSILDQGWFECRRQLEYKQAWAGGQVIVVNPRNTSRTCPDCKHVSADSRLTQAKFACVKCDYTGNADLVGAINILAAGHAVLACGVTVQQDHTMKHEPTEGFRDKRKPVGISRL
jgi:putative transposase